MSGPGMDDDDVNGGDPNGNDPGLLAAEYVLGVLSADEAASCADRRRRDPAFARLVDQWERRLMPLAALVPPVPPPPGLRDRIEAAMAAPTAIPARPAAHGIRRQLWFWRGLSFASLAAACVLGALLWLRPPAREVVALLPPGANAGGFLVTPSGGDLRFIPVRAPAIPAGRDLQLWSLPAGATVPQSLGVLPPGGTVLPAGRVPSGAGQLLVSLEPAGGSTTGLPTGPVVLAGQLQGQP